MKIHEIKYVKHRKFGTIGEIKHVVSKSFQFSIVSKSRTASSELGKLSKFSLDGTYGPPKKFPPNRLIPRRE